MNATLKSIITNPFVIGGTIAVAGAVTAAVIYAKKRPKTDAEIALEKEKELHEQELRLKEVEAKRALEEVEKQEETKRQAKAEEESTKRVDSELQLVKEKNAEAARVREWEKNMPDAYWHYKEAEAVAAKQASLAEKELNNQKEIARIQADAVKSEAEANARAAKDAALMGLRRQESADRADTAKWQAVANAASSMVTGRNNNS